MNRGRGELERAIMNVLWTRSEPLTARDVLRALGDPAMAYTTVKTVLDRLHDKRLVRRERDQRAWRYRAVSGRDDHVAELMLHALGQTGDRDGALVRFVRAVSPADAEVLRAALDVPSGTDGSGQGGDPR